MERCARCFKGVEPSWAYCPVCSRPRILESLQTPVAESVRQQQAWQALIALVSVWLVVTGRAVVARQDI